MVKRPDEPLLLNDLGIYLPANESSLKHFWRKVAWGVLFVLIALWVGYESAEYLGMFAVTLQEGLK